MLERCNRCSTPFTLHSETEYPLNACPYCGARIRAASSHVPANPEASIWLNLVEALPHPAQPIVLRTSGHLKALKSFHKVIEYISEELQECSPNEELFSQKRPRSRAAGLVLKPFRSTEIADRRKALRIICLLASTSNPTFTNLGTLDGRKETFFFDRPSFMLAYCMAEYPPQRFGEISGENLN